MMSERVLSIEVPAKEVSELIEFVKSLDANLTILEKEKSRAEPSLTLMTTILIGISIDITAQVLYDLLKYVMAKKYRVRFLS